MSWGQRWTATFIFLQFSFNSLFLRSGFLLNSLVSSTPTMLTGCSLGCTGKWGTMSGWISFIISLEEQKKGVLASAVTWTLSTGRFSVLPMGSESLHGI